MEETRCLESAMSLYMALSSRPCVIQVEGWRAPRGSSCAAGPRAEAAFIVLSGLLELGEQRVAAIANRGRFSVSQLCRCGTVTYLE
jgi:hypothetical protein